MIIQNSSVSTLNTDRSQSRDLQQTLDHPVDEQRSKEPLDRISIGKAVHQLGELTNQLMEKPDNSDKVARIQAQIAAGSFEIDTRKIADQLLWGERIAAQHELDLRAP